MIWTIVGLAVVAFVLLYALWLRGWLKTRPWAAGFFAKVEPAERLLFKKSETILWARLKMLVGVVLAILTTAGTIDITPLLPLIPDQYEQTLLAIFNLLPLLVTLVGFVDEKLRRGTSLPLEIVALPEKDMTPAVAQAVAAVAETNAQAVAVVAAETGK